MEVGEITGDSSGLFHIMDGNKLHLTTGNVSASLNIHPGATANLPTITYLNPPQFFSGEVCGVDTMVVQDSLHLSGNGSTCGALPGKYHLSFVVLPSGSELQAVGTVTLNATVCVEEDYLIDNSIVGYLLYDLGI